MENQIGVFIGVFITLVGPAAVCWIALLSNQYSATTQLARKLRSDIFHRLFLRNSKQRNYQAKVDFFAQEKNTTKHELISLGGKALGSGEREFMEQ